MTHHNFTQMEILVFTFYLFKANLIKNNCYHNVHTEYKDSLAFVGLYWSNLCVKTTLGTWKNGRCSKGQKDRKLIKDQNLTKKIRSERPW